MTIDMPLTNLAGYWKFNFLDFCEFSVVELAINKNETEPTNKCYVKQIEKITVDSSIEENAKIKEIVIKYLGIENKKIN